VTHYQIHGWTNDRTPENIEAIIDLINIVETDRQNSGKLWTITLNLKFCSKSKVSFKV